LVAVPAGDRERGPGTGARAGHKAIQSLQLRGAPIEQGQVHDGLVFNHRRHRGRLGLQQRAGLIDFHLLLHRARLQHEVRNRDLVRERLHAGLHLRAESILLHPDLIVAGKHDGKGKVTFLVGEGFAPLAGLGARNADSGSRDLRPLTILDGTVDLSRLSKSACRAEAEKEQCKNPGGAHKHSYAAAYVSVFHTSLQKCVLVKMKKPTSQSRGPTQRRPERSGPLLYRKGDALHDAARLHWMKFSRATTKHRDGEAMHLRR